MDQDRAEELFHRLSPLNAEARAELLEEIEAEDPSLAGELQALLAAHDLTRGALDELQSEVAPGASGAGGFSPPASLTGATIGHYEVGELLGRGGMGEVYRARDTRLGREVALKFLPAWLDRDPTLRDRFIVEAKVVSSIDHTNVCGLLDLGETEDGRLFLIMPYYEGETLKARLGRGSLPAAEAVTITLQAARGLAAAHERGIVHRDVKPSNLLLTPDGRVKVLDFGVAKLEDFTLTRTGETPGTMTYMSPEQREGGEVDARSDLWSLGAVLYEMVTGKRPVGEARVAERLAEAGVPGVLADIMTRLLAPLPEDRYPDARSLAEDLAVLAAGPAALRARPTPSPKRFLAELKRRNVFQVAALYGAVGFGVIEVADLVFPRVGLPGWTITLVVWLVILGFPIALVLAWAFEATPSGVRRTRRVEPALLDAIATQPAGRRWPIGLAGLAGGAILLVGAWMALSGKAEPPGRSTDAVPPEIRRLAVLPFVNQTGDPEREYFVAGMHDALILELAQVEALTVLSRQTMARYAGSELPLPTIAEEVGADALVEGAVFLAGDSVRINVQLIRARPEGHLWADAYRGTLQDALGFQGQTAREIATAVRATVSPEVEARLASAYAPRPEAQDAYLRGIYLQERRFAGDLPPAVERDTLLAAISYLEDAVELDPEWPAAHARLAQAYHVLATRASGIFEAEFFPKSKAAAHRALELDENEAVAHQALGWVLFNWDRDWTGADRAFRRALDLNPSLTGYYGVYLQNGGRWDEAVEMLEKFQERYPLVPAATELVAWAYACAGRTEAAVASFRQLDLDNSPGLADDLRRLGLRNSPGLTDDRIGLAYALGGAFAEAISVFEEAVAASDSFPQFLAHLGWAHARAGNEAEARTILRRLESAGEPSWYAPELYAALGDTDTAVAHVLAWFEQRGRQLDRFLCSPAYRELSDDPRIRDLVIRIGYPGAR